jgi:hypothetical protein
MLIKTDSELLKKIIPLVIHHNKRREIDDFDLSHRFHAQFFERDQFHFLMLDCARIAAGPPMLPR